MIRTLTFKTPYPNAAQPQNGRDMAVGTSPEIVEDGVTGMLVPPSDPETMAAKLLAYADDPGLAEAHGRAGHAHVRERFSLAAMLDGCRGIYDDLA